MHVANRRAATLGLLDRKRLEMARALARTRRAAARRDRRRADRGGEPGLVASILELRSAGSRSSGSSTSSRRCCRSPSAVCMSAGRVIAEGDRQAVMSDPAVIDAYLGARHERPAGRGSRGAPRAAAGGARRLAAHRRGRDAGARRRQRGRQVDAAAGDRRRAAASEWGRIVLDGEDVTRCAPTSVSARASRWCPRGASCSSA